MNEFSRAMSRAIGNRAKSTWSSRSRSQLSSGVGVLALVALAPPAYAANECGAAPGTVTCTAAGNTYPNGVTYTGVAADTTVVLNAATVINTTPSGNRGVTLQGTAPNLTVTSAAGSTITTTGNNATAIVAGEPFGVNNITVNGGTLSTQGANAYGVEATSFTGNVLVNGASAQTSGTNAFGIRAASALGGNATVTGGTIATTGDGSTGVDVSGGFGGNAVAAPASVTTSGVNAAGIRVQANGGTAQAGTLATNVTTSGAGSTGIVANGSLGTTVNYNNVTTTGATNAVGISVVTGGTSTTINGATTGLLSTTGTNSNGINAAATTGGVAVNVGRVSATGLGSTGILATGAGGAVNVTSTGVVANGNAVEATNIGGVANVTLSGTNNSVAGSGAVITGSTTAGLALTGGTLNGGGLGGNGATLTSATGATVTNSGTITGANAAIVVGGAGSALITNNAAGTITGRVLLTGNADTVNNAGTFNANSASLFGGGADTFNNSGTYNANASQDFGTGADVFNNSGTFRILPTAVVPGTVTLIGLETFNNSGLIDLRNGHTGEGLAIPGNYFGSGAAALAIDVGLNTGPTTSDLLTVGGAATGSTAVTINRLGTPAVLSSAAGTTFVDAGLGTTANAFVIAPASQFDGVIQYGVVFNPLTNDFALVSAPSAVAYRTSLFGDGVRNLWLQSGDAWTAHMREARDNMAASGPGGSGGRFWFQGLGNWEKRTSSRTVTFNGITSNVDLGYDQDYYGVQIGLDLGAPVTDAGGFQFGVTGGYQNSNMSFPNTADRIKFNAINGGVYAAFNTGIFFVNALGKYDYYWGENVSPAGLYRADVNGSVWGAKAEAGLRFGKDFFIEPAVSVSWTHSDFGDFGVPSGNFAINDEDGLRGKAGARIGTVFNSGDSTKVTVYGGANYVREFRGRSNVVFTSGGQTAAFNSPRNQDYVEGTLGVNIGSDAGKISGFFEGRYADGRDYDGYGARGGMRVRF